MVRFAEDDTYGGQDTYAGQEAAYGGQQETYGGQDWAQEGAYDEAAYTPISYTHLTLPTKA